MSTSKLTRPIRPNRRCVRRSRRGTATLILVIAAGVLSMVVLSLARSTRFAAQQSRSVESTIRGEMVIESLVNRARVLERLTVTTSGLQSDPVTDARYPDARFEIVGLPGLRFVEIELYPGATKVRRPL